MKFAIYLLALLTGGAAEAAPSWKMDDTVYYVHEPRLEITLQNLAADEEYWDVLFLDLRYDLSDAEKEVTKLKAENPGASVVRVMLQKDSNYRLEIPSLGIDEMVGTKPGVEGPYFTATYYISRRDSAKVRKAYESADFLRVSGSLLASVPETEIMERAELLGSVCQEFSGGDVYSAIRSYPAVEKRIQAAARFPANRERLRKLVLNGCLELPQRATLDSFAELMATPLKTKPMNGKFVSELSRTVTRERPIPLSYSVVRGRTE